MADRLTDMLLKLSASSEEEYRSRRRWRLLSAIAFPFVAVVIYLVYVGN